MIAILVGAPGVGKGTQAKKIVAAFGVPHVSTGDMLRAAIEAGSALGQRVASYLEQGQLVPDELILDVVADRLQQADCQRGCLLDGFPRTLPQAAALQTQLAAAGKKLDAVIHLVADVGEVQDRLLKRAEIEGRADDTEQTIQERLRVYQRQTEPLVDYYRQRGLLHEVDGMGTPEEVFQRVQQVLSEDSSGES